MTMTNWNLSPVSETSNSTGREKNAGLSLTISPDLDALLEFDEKTRSGRLVPRTPRSGPASASLAMPSVGLPPPPRKKPLPSAFARRGHSPVSATPLEGALVPNPYINPTPPPLHKVDPPVIKIRHSPFDLHPPDGAGDDGEGRQLSGATSPSVAAKNRVDKLLSMKKIPFGIFSESKGEMMPGRRLGRVMSKGRHTVEAGSDETSHLNEEETERIAWNKLDGVGANSISTCHREAPSHGRWLTRQLSGSAIPSGMATTVSLPPSPSIVSFPGMHSDKLAVALSASDRNHDSSFFDMYSPSIPRFSLSDDDNDDEDDGEENERESSRTPSPHQTSSAIRELDVRRALPRNWSAGHYETACGHRNDITGNFLDLDEKSDLVRKNRKLIRMFGQSPGPDALSQQETGRPQKPNSFTFPSSDRAPATFSWSNRIDVAAAPRGAAPPYAHDRRHSEPLSPDGYSLLESDSGHRPDLSETRGHALASSHQCSFIDLSDESSPKKAGDGRSPSPSQESVSENVTFDEQADELRRRKRDKIARLHRFLGSQVPVNLVLGLDDPDTTLPPPLQKNGAVSMPEANNHRKSILRRRRCSSVEAFGSKWSDDIDRIKEDLNVKEKALNVRRAQKMEKLFGVAPPQTLYHTRRPPSPSIMHTITVPSPNMVSGWTFPGESLPAVMGQRNLNRSSYIKPKKKKDRPNTSESNQFLLPKQRHDWTEIVNPPRRRQSLVYSHYHESLNSLHEIMERDDQESLAELRNYLHSGDMTVPPPKATSLGFVRPLSDRRTSIASSVKSERRLSLPTSVLSSTSDLSSLALSPPEPTDFQTRRRRAAKLTQFFGVNYRELITDVLESIEHGLVHEHRRGTLNQDEVQDLLARLRKLRTKREAYYQG